MGTQTILATALAGAWVLAFARAWRGILAIPRLADVDLPVGGTAPSVAVVVPARNEVDSIEDTLDSLLAQDLDELEVVVVDDGSTDGTGELANRRAERDDRLRVLHLDEPPDGWLGKVHAIARGVGASGGEWILLADADVRFEPDAVRRALAHAERWRLDHLAAIPEVDAPTFAMRVAVSAFGLLTFVRASEHVDPDSDVAFGIGGFNLVRRDALERTPGLAWLRLEPVDDVGVARLIRDHGGRSSLVAAHDAARLAWYPGLGAMIRGLEKNAFAFAGRYRYGRTIALAVAMALFAVGPLLAAAAPHPVARAAAVLAALALILCARAARRRFGSPFLAALLAPVGIATLAFTMLWSAWKAWRRGGIAWRGRLHPIDELREHQRVWLRP